MTVDVDAAVLERWAVLAARSSKPTIELRFSSQLGSKSARDCLDRALSRVLSEFGDRHRDEEGDDEPPGAGVWSVTKVPGGVLVTAGQKCEAFPDLLAAIVRQMERDEVSGRIELYAMPTLPELPVHVDLITGHLRLSGARVHDRIDRWTTTEEVLRRVAEAAAQWCLQAPPDLGVLLQSGIDAPPVALMPGIDPIEEVRDALTHDYRVQLSSIGSERFRTVSTDGMHGRITLIEGGLSIQRYGWHTPVQAITGFLREHSLDLVYAYIKRGDELDDAALGLPARAPNWGSRPVSYELQASAHEDHLVPDAFAIQLLGPGYANQIPTGAAWKQTTLGAGRVLLEHSHLDRWFSAPTATQARHAAVRPDLDVHIGARHDFAAILVDGDAIAQQHRSRGIPGPEENYVQLSEPLHTKVLGFTPQLIGSYKVALVLKDESVIEDVEIGYGGYLVTRIAERDDFDIRTQDIKDVLERTTF